MAKATKKATKKASPKASRKTPPKASPPVTVDRRKPKPDRRKQGEPVAAGSERRKVQRRRKIDPTTCERDYTDAEVEFMRALDEYKRTSGRMFPTCSEILEVIANLGYEKRGTQPAAATPDQMIEIASAPAMMTHPAEDDMMEPHAV